MRLNGMHISYKDWQKVSQKAKAVGIRTFAELEMYCRVWEIKTALELLVTLSNDYIEVLLEKRKKIWEVKSFGND